MKMVRRAFNSGAVAFALVVAGASHAAAQSEPAPVDSTRIANYAHAHAALDKARDEFHGKVGRIHDEQGRERARVELDEEIAAALQAASLTRPQYDEITLLVSMNGDARKIFDEVMAELEGGGGTGGPS